MDFLKETQLRMAKRSLKEEDRKEESD